MPYFTRKPYAEMQREAQDASARADAEAAAADFAALAEQVLAEDTATGPKSAAFIARDAAGPMETARMILTLHNPDPTPRLLTFAPGDLTGPGGARIPASAVAVTPARMILPAGASEDVSLLLTIPAEAAAGRYTGPLGLGDMADQVAQIGVNVARMGGAG